MSDRAQEQRTLYANLMEEVKARFDVVNHVSNGRSGLAAPFVREFLYLQTRFLCELVALACLVAHGDIDSLKSHKVGRSYSADEILDRMAKLRPHFFPIAMREVRVTKMDLGAENHELEAVNPAPLTKEDLIRLYVKTHKHLHRGSLKKLLSSSAQPLDLKINVPEIIADLQRISDLLGHHLIAIDESQLMICLLMNPKDNNKVQVVGAERHDLPLPSIPQAHDASATAG